MAPRNRPGFRGHMAWRQTAERLASFTATFIIQEGRKPTVEEIKRAKMPGLQSDTAIAIARRNMLNTAKEYDDDPTNPTRN